MQPHFLVYNFYQTRCSQGFSANTFVIHSFINSLISSALSSKSSKCLHSQTLRGRELKFCENVHPPKRVMCHVSCVMCHVSCVMCHVSRVTCHVSHITCQDFLFLFFFSDKVVKLIGGGSVINGAYPV